MSLKGWATGQPDGWDGQTPAHCVTR